MKRTPSLTSFSDDELLRRLSNLLGQSRRDEADRVAHIAKLAPHLTLEDREALLKRAAHRSRREIEELVAELSPRPDAPAVMRKLPDRRAGTASPAGRLGRDAEVPSLGRCPEGGASVDRQLRPDGVAARARAASGRSCSTAGLCPTRQIPAAVKRAVYERDGGRCHYEDEQRRRCSARQGLEFHHRRPFGLGGDHSVDNVSLACRCHNGYLAEIDYGRKTYGAAPALGDPSLGADAVSISVAVTGGSPVEGVSVAPSGLSESRPAKAGRLEQAPVIPRFGLAGRRGTRRLAGAALVPGLSVRIPGARTPTRPNVLEVTLP